MTSLVGLFVAIAAVSGFVARLLVPSARDQPLIRTALVGAAVTAVSGFACWFLVTPVDGVLRTPVGVTVPVVLGLAAVAVWRSRLPKAR